MKENSVSAPDEDHDSDEEEEETSESVSIDAGAIKNKFETLAAALAETNQNLVTFEYLLEHSRKNNKHPESPNTKDGLTKCDNDGSKEDIVNLLRDICGSVNDLRSEMGHNISSVDLKHDLKTQNLMETTDLKDKCNKLEFEVECLKAKLSTSEEKLLEEKRKTLSLEEIVQEQKAEIRKLGSFLKEADDFSKESERECHFLKKEIHDIKQELQKESLQKETLSKDLDNVKKLYNEYEEKLRVNDLSSVENSKLKRQIKEYESKVELLETERKRAADELLDYQAQTLCHRNVKGEGEELPPLDLEGLPTTSRSTLSSKSGVSEEKSYEELRSSHKRLKKKTRLLLKQYRAKRSLVDRRERQLAGQRAGLMKLQTLHQSVEANHYIVIHHLGQQLVQISKLVSTLWPDSDNVLDQLFTERENKLSEWILYIDNLSSWIVQKLVSVSLRRREKHTPSASDLAYTDIELEKHSLDISEAAKNQEAVMFKEIQQELITELDLTRDKTVQGEQTDADTSQGTWM